MRTVLLRIAPASILHSKHFEVAYALMIFSLLVSSGCQQEDAQSIRTDLRLKAIVAAYMDFAAARGVGPADAHQLREHMPHTIAFTAAQEVSESDDLSLMFLSARDDMPFVIEFGLPLAQALSGDPRPPIAYESQGSHGTRFVAFANGETCQIEVDEESCDFLPHSMATSLEW